MKFTLKDYQEQAVDDVLYNLKRARENFKNKREISFENAVPRNSHLMAGLGKNRGQIAGMDTRHILIELAGSFDPPGCP